MTVVILTGGIDLSVGSVLALSVLVAASVSKAGIPAPFAWSCAPSHGSSSGLGQRFRRLAPPPSSLHRHAGNDGVRARPLLHLHGGGPPSRVRRPIPATRNGRSRTRPRPALIFGAAFIVVFILLERCPWGEHIRNTGSNPVAAWDRGIDVPRNGLEGVRPLRPPCRPCRTDARRTARTPLSRARGSATSSARSPPSCWGEQVSQEERERSPEPSSAC